MNAGNPYPMTANVGQQGGIMAVYKYNRYLEQSQHQAFDKLWKPGEQPNYSGIFRCEACGANVACNAGNPLPPQNHAQHHSGADIRWRLIVSIH